MEVLAEFMVWISEVGTNVWLGNFIDNNTLLLSLLGLGGFFAIKQKLTEKSYK